MTCGATIRYTLAGLALALALTLAAGGCGDGGQSAADMDTSLDAPVPTANGFGDYCTYMAHECRADLVCIRESMTQVGFCSEYCQTKGQRCTTAPAGSLAECTLSLTAQPGKLACLFLCGASGGVTYRCPVSLSCKTDQPVGGGLYRCVP